MPLPEAYRGAKNRVDSARRDPSKRSEKHLRSFLFGPDDATHFAPRPPDEFG